MPSSCLRILLGIAFICLQNSLAALPPDVQLCKAEDTACISKVTTDLLNKNPKGRPELGIPKIEPFHINSLIINDRNNGPINFGLSFKDIDVSGLSRAVVNRAVGFSKDPTTSKFEMYGTLPELRLRGKYKADGRVLLLPIQGEGDCEIIFERVKLSAKFKPNVIKKDGLSYLEVNKLKILMEPTNVRTRLSNLFNGDKTLGENMNKFLNENWKDVWTEISGSVNIAIAEIMKNIMQNLFKRFPYDDIYQK